MEAIKKTEGLRIIIASEMILSILMNILQFLQDVNGQPMKLEFISIFPRAQSLNLMNPPEFWFTRIS